MAAFTYKDIERLKTKIALEAGLFEADHQGCIVKIAIEVRNATGGEKIKVAMAGPYAPTLPGMDEIPKTERDHVQERLRRWQRENPGGRDANP